MGERQRLGLRRVGELALAEVAELVGCPAEGVTAIRKDEDGWVVTVEVLELARVPETTDVLASYDVRVDGQGEVTEYRRLHRFLRAQVES
jgi:hypothetical protein